MFTKTSKIGLVFVITILIATVFLFTGYGANNSDLEEPITLASEAPLFFADADELLAAIGMAKFSEFAISEVAAFAISGNIEAHGFDSLQNITALYKPTYVKQGFAPAGISVHGSNVLTFHNTNVAGDVANFIWSRSIAAENATTDFFGRGAIAEFFEEFNGITYAITKWVTFDTREPDGWVVAWAQNGQAFMASLPASYTEEDVLAFCDAQAITSWELDGNAVSVSIQSMGNVSLFELESPVGGEATHRSSTEVEIIAIGNTLYRTGIGRSMERVGYKWLIDDTVQRYQYVLKPGVYEFRANNIANPSGLLVKHFAYGDHISSTDYTEELIDQSASEFNLIVTPDPGNSILSFPVLENTEFTVTYNANGGIGTMAAREPFERGEIVMANSSTFIRPGWIQMGWRLDDPIRGATVPFGSSFVIQYDATLYAHWMFTGRIDMLQEFHNPEPEHAGFKFTVTYNANGGTGTMAVREPFDRRNIVTTDPSAFSRPSWIQVGWRLDHPTRGAFIPSGGSFVIQYNATLYAEWVFIGP
ncbi:MAG: InlB B-repeat-containing protein [Oscillospiraceae bacterium]|nr:InlB B-repeat-containing protein [Oscillospiraceae bacterium]